MVLGQPLEDCRVYIKRASKQALALDWFNDVAKTVPSNLTGVSMRMVVGDRDAPTKTWTASIVANRSTWNLSPSDTDLDGDYLSGVLIMNDGSADILLFRLQIEVED